MPIRIALEQVEETPSELLLDRLERHRVDVVLVEPSRLTLPLEEFIRRLKMTATQPAVFVLHTEVTTHLILESLRAGASEYLYPPLTETLRRAFENLSMARAKSGTGRTADLGKIFGFISAKGGCGATTIACHVATNMAKAMNQPMLLADMDFEAGLVRFVMKTKTTYSVRDALNNLNRMDASYWKALVSPHTHKLDVIVSPDEVAMKDSATGEEMVHMMRFIRATYPAAVVDFGRCSNTAAFEAIKEMEALYLVSSPDAFALQHACRVLQSIETGSPAASRLKVLINKSKDGLHDRKASDATAGLPPAAIFGFDFASLHEAYSEGQLLDSGTKLGKQFQNFALDLVSCVRGETPTESKQRRTAAKKWLSFLPTGAGNNQ